MFKTSLESGSQSNDVAAGVATISDVLRRRAELTPHQRVFVSLDRGEREGASYTFAELDRKAMAIGSRLVALGAKGKRVLLPHPARIRVCSELFRLLVCRGCSGSGLFNSSFSTPTQSSSIYRGGCRSGIHPGGVYRGINLLS